MFNRLEFERNFMATKLEDNLEEQTETVIGPTAIIQGELTSQGSIKIEGQIIGSITTSQTVAITDKAKIMADVSAESAVIGGEVQGNLTISKRLVLLPTAKVAADIHCPTLKVEEGALYTGRCHMTGNIPFIRANKTAETLNR